MAVAVAIFVTPDIVRVEGLIGTPIEPVLLQAEEGLYIEPPSPPSLYEVTNEGMPDVRATGE